VRLRLLIQRVISISKIEFSPAYSRGAFYFLG
jgi:hypothetical protein